MKLLPLRLSLIYPILAILIIVISVNSSSTSERDPFKSLGIPDLNPKALLSEIEQETVGRNPKKDNQSGLPQLKTIEDLPNFLKNSNLNEDDGVKILTRFLIQDDFTLKKFGVVYDQSGFDGISLGERIAPIGTEERLMQRARSASNIWFKEKYSKLQEYDAYGAEALMDEIVPNWRIYKVLMIGKTGENTFIKVCLPLDESETALCSDKDELCGPRTEYVEKEKKKNEEYIQRIRTNNFFKKKNVIGAVKLLPGEKLVAKEGNNKIVMDSSNIDSKLSSNNSFFNPPILDSVSHPNNDNLFNAYRMKNNINGFNPAAGMGMNLYNMNNLNQPPMQSFAPQTLMPNGNGFNSNMTPGMMNNIQNNNLNGMMSNNIPQQQQFKPNFGRLPIAPAPTEPNTTYNFRQRDIPTPNSSSQSMNPNSSIDNLQLMNELMQMKTQLNQLMTSLKQKDEIINQQNSRLSQISAGNVNNMNSGNVNNMNTGNVNNMNTYSNQFSDPNINMNTPATGFLSAPMMA